MNDREFSPAAFGQRMKERREALGLTLEDLQERVHQSTGGATGSSYGTLWNYEKGKTAEPRPNIVNAIGEALRVPVPWLMWDEGEPGTANMVVSEQEWTEKFLGEVKSALHDHFGPRVHGLGRAVFIHAWQDVQRNPEIAVTGSGTMTMDGFARALAAALHEVEGYSEPFGTEGVTNYLVQVAPAMARVLHDHFRASAGRIERIEDTNQEENDG